MSDCPPLPPPSFLKVDKAPPCCSHDFSEDLETAVEAAENFPVCAGAQPILEINSEVRTGDLELQKEVRDDKGLAARFVRTFALVDQPSALYGDYRSRQQSFSWADDGCFRKWRWMLNSSEVCQLGDRSSFRAVFSAFGAEAWSEET